MSNSNICVTTGHVLYMYCNLLYEINSIVVPPLVFLLYFLITYHNFIYLLKFGVSAPSIREDTPISSPRLGVELINTQSLDVSIMSTHVEQGTVEEYTHYNKTCLIRSTRQSLCECCLDIYFSFIIKKSKSTVFA